MPANGALRAGTSRKMIAVLCAALALAGLQLSGCTAPATPVAPAAQPTATQAARPAEQALPSWRDGAARQALLKFVADVTTPGSPGFVGPEARVAVFDNDGTLWSEQPLYFQFFFLLDQVRAAAPQHPEWRNNAAFKALMANDMNALMANQKQLLGLIATANSGMSVDEYDRTIRDWLSKARHPRFKRPYTELVYQPQLELLSYLRANGFKTYIVSGGTIDFMRPWSQQVYGIPPEQVIGSSQAVRYMVRDGKPVLMRDPKLDFIDDGPGKPVGIYRHIGRRPILAVGNSDGDLQMLEYTAGGDGPRMAVLVHHDDAEREFAYDRQSKVGKLDKALDAARAKGWTVVSMKQDWQQIYPAAKP
ncbi:HAD family hydrolase [Cupriavidus oxalaticus]|uniref:HAD family hydrolase n=1 Tax=Cupriavidus oxalaticus TaxID=96344 RepID=UPI00316C8648